LATYLVVLWDDRLAIESISDRMRVANSRNVCVRVVGGVVVSVVAVAVVSVVVVRVVSVVCANVCLGINASAI